MFQKLSPLNFRSMKLNQLSFEAKLAGIGIIIFIFCQIYVGFPELAISWDAFGYYLYLPYAFIYNDLSFSDLSHVQSIADQYQSTDTLYQLTLASNGNHVIKYPAGIAILMSPFFFIGHCGAILFGYPADGFSAPYDFMVSIGNLFYVLIGVVYLRKVLKHFFSSKIAVITLFALIIGTNFLQMAISSAGNSHIPLFALHAMALYFTIIWHKTPSILNSSKLGVIIGLMIIARPTEIVFLFIPILWGVRSIRGFFDKYYELIKNNWKSLFVFSFAIIAIGLIQLGYWKSVTGEWFFYSYDNAGEGFEFFNPYTYDFLFSYRKGWYLYTPIMLIATIGLLFTLKKKYDFGLSLIIFFGLNIWIVSSWSCWWYAGSFSQRSMIQSYPEMAFGLATIISTVYEKTFIRNLILSIVSFLITLNLFQSWQFDKRIIDASRMTRDYYWAVFGRTSVPSNAKKLLMINRPSVQKTNPEAIEEYEKSRDLIIEKNIEFDEDQEFVDFEKTPFEKVTSKDHAWIKVSGKSTIIVQGELEDFLMVTCFTHDNRKYQYVAWSPTEMKTYSKDNKTNYFEFWYLTPEVRSPKDEFTFEIWNRAKSHVKIEDLRIESFTKK